MTPVELFQFRKASFMRGFTGERQMQGDDPWFYRDGVYARLHGLDAGFFESQHASQFGDLDIFKNSDDD